jgi:predicted transcriptional regulator of viral defense system
VIEEMKEKILADKLFKAAENYPEPPTIQRLGYLFEYVLDDVEISHSLHPALITKDFYPTLLRPHKEKPERMITGNRWKVVQNIEVEADL